MSDGLVESMDIEKILKIATTSLAQYVQDFMLTIVRPWAESPAVGSIVLAQDQKPFSHDDSTNVSAVLDGQLWTFVFLSVFIGSTLTAITKKKADDLQTVVVYLVTSWLAFSAYAYLFCRFVLRGKASFASSTRTILYVLSVTYVISSFCSLLGSLGSPALYEKGDPDHWIPRVVYVAIQGLLLSYLLTRNLATLNRFLGGANLFLLYYCLSQYSS